MFFFHRKKRSKWVVTAAIVLGVGLFVFSQRVAIRDFWEEQKKADLPAAQGLEAFTQVNTNTTQKEVINTNAAVAVPTTAEAGDIEDLTEPNLPKEINLKVPFTVQAPHANWDEEHREFCEEASVLMVSRYFEHLGIGGPNEAEAALQDIKQWEIKNLGFYKDTTAEETAKIVRERFKFKDVETIINPTLANIKAEVAAGNPVIVPAAGRLIGNPFYRQPGPLYHMLVIKGYTKDGKLITNDPGTKRGADWVYDPKVILNANHDWNDGDVVNGQRIVIVVRGE